MSAENTADVPAFPVVHPPVEGVTMGGVEHYGMTLRDYFAAKAIDSIMRDDRCTSYKMAAVESYKVADAMLKARKQ